MKIKYVFFFMFFIFVGTYILPGQELTAHMEILKQQLEAAYSKH